jgi:hypothetical protein
LPPQLSNHLLRSARCQRGFGSPLEAIIIENTVLRSPRQNKNAKHPPRKIAMICIGISSPHCARCVSAYFPSFHANILLLADLPISLAEFESRYCGQTDIRRSSSIISTIARPTSQMRSMRRRPSNGRHTQSQCYSRWMSLTSKLLHRNNLACRFSTEDAEPASQSYHLLQR